MSKSIDRLTVAPGEIQLLIMKNLSCTDVISLSQTNKHFHKHTRLKKEDYVWSLLEQEVLPEHGGTQEGIPVDGIDLPPGRDAIGSDMAWACTSCVRLLPRGHFDIDAITAVEFLKPGPYSAYGEVPMWGEQKELTMKENPRECPELGKLFKLRDPESSPGTIEQAVEMTQNIMNVIRLLLAYVPPADMLIDFLGEHRAAVEKLNQKLSGCSRFFRTCINCRFQRGDFSNNRGPDGVPNAPIVESRAEHFINPLQRYFPSLLDPEQYTVARPCPSLPERKPSRIVDVDWTLHMIRCPGCEVWQEQRAFRIVSHSLSTYPPTFENRDGVCYSLASPNILGGLAPQKVLCNRCFAHEHGRQALGRHLGEWARIVAEQQSWKHKEELHTHWEEIHSQILTLNSQVREVALPICATFSAQAEARREAIGSGLPGFMYMPLKEIGPFFRAIRDAVLEFYQPRVTVDPDPAQMKWIHDYFIWAAHLDQSLRNQEFLETLVQRVNDNADRLADWALERGAFCLT